jgi:hypothetical protein
MQITRASVIRLAAACCVLGTLAGANAAPLSPEDRYIAARDAAIAKITKLYDDKQDEVAQKADAAVRGDLLLQLKAIVGETERKGYGPVRLSLMSLSSSGDEDYGALDGLRFEALIGENGEKAGRNGADGKYVEPKAFIVVTTQKLFEHWLHHDHKEWLRSKDLSQNFASALKDETFYTTTFPNGSAMVNFSSLPIAKPAAATFAYAMLGGRTQDAMPNAANEIYVAAIANGKAYVASSTIKPKVQVPGCIAIKSGYEKKAEKAGSNFQSGKLGKKADDKLPDYRQQGEDAYKKCFAERAPREPAFAEATKQAQALLATAMGP